MSVSRRQRFASSSTLAISGEADGGNAGDCYELVDDVVLDVRDHHRVRNELIRNPCADGLDVLGVGEAGFDVV